MSNYWKLLAALALSVFPIACSAISDPAGGAEPAIGHPSAPNSETATKSLVSRVQESPTLLAPLGVATPEEASRLVIHRQLPIGLVPLDELAYYKNRRAQPSTLVKAFDLHLALLAVDGEVRALSYVAGHGDGARIQRSGGSNYARLIERAIAYALTLPGFDESRASLVEIRALGRAYIAFPKGNDLMMVPVLADDALGHQAPEVLSAHELFLRLAAEAMSEYEKSQSAPTQP